MDLVGEGVQFEADLVDFFAARGVVLVVRVWVAVRLGG